MVKNKTDKKLNLENKLGKDTIGLFAIIDEHGSDSKETKQYISERKGQYKDKKYAQEFMELTAAIIHIKENKPNLYKLINMNKLTHIE
jgi:hypothetical protein